jgi:hypothetical protein
MRKGDRLCALQVRVPGHHHIEMLFGETEQRPLQIPQARRDFRDLRFDVKPHVERNLVVPTSRGVQFRASGPDSFGERGFDIHVHVLERCVPLKFSGVEFLLDFAKPGFDLFLFRSGDNPRFNQRGHVSDGAGDVVPVQLTIEGSGLTVTPRYLAQ